MDFLLIEDKANKEGKHSFKNQFWEKNGIKVERYALPVGDYILWNDKVSEMISRKLKRGLEPKKMDFLGCYDVCVDTKENIQEIIGNICGKQHARFRDEAILAQNNGIKLYVLIENLDGITCIDDLFRWHNPRLDIWAADKNNVIGTYKNGNPRYAKKRKYPTATTGVTLAKAMITMELKYGVKFIFCKPNEAGQKVLNTLTK